MNIAIVNKDNIITNVVVFDEPKFKEDDTHKYLTPGLWIGDVYTKEIPKDVASEIEANKIVNKAFSSFTKLQLVEMIADLNRQLEEKGGENK
jgi:hypothetical protein